MKIDYWTLSLTSVICTNVRCHPFGEREDPILCASLEQMQVKATLRPGMPLNLAWCEEGDGQYGHRPPQDGPGWEASLSDS